RENVLAKRLLTIEWQPRDVAEVAHGDAGALLLINMTGNGDLLTTTLSDVLKFQDVDCTTMSWPQHADHQANAERLRGHVTAGRFTDIVAVTPPPNGNPDEECA